jgi:phosphatidylglycerol:prolipoprotein diacylglycerol transferase
VNPWLLWTEPLQLPTYFTLLMTGFALATFVLRDEALARGVPPRVVMDAALRVLPAVLIGARLFHVVLEEPAAYLRDPWSALSPAGGWVFYGGLAAGVLVLRRFVRSQPGLSLWTLADCFAPAVAFGLVFGRLGCLGAGCCHGRPADWPLGVEVPWSIVYYRPGRLPEALLGVPVHPTPIYEGALCLGLYAALSRYGRRWPPGATALTFFGAYGLGRAFIELFRGDVMRGLWLGGWLSTSQIIGLVTGGMSLALVWRMTRVRSH